MFSNLQLLSVWKFVSVGLNLHTQHPRPGAVAYFNLSSALVLPFTDSERMCLQKSLLDGKVVGKEVRRLSSALSLGSQPLSLGSKPGTGVGVRALGRRGWRGTGSGFLIFGGAVGRMIP